MQIKCYNIFIPTNFDIITVKNKKNLKDLSIIIYNNKLSLTFFNTNNTLKIDLESYSLLFTKYTNTLYSSNIHYCVNEINKYIKTIEECFFIKIKFKGKGFKIKFNKKSRLIKFYFGRSHRTFYKLKHIKLKRVTKYKFVLKDLNLSKLKQVSSNITYIKPVNVYTLRGIRISRQFIFKRKGKKSSYM